MIRRRFLLLALFLLLPGPAARSADRRILIPIEEFLPSETTFFLSLPNARAVLDVLARTGETEAAFAGRLTARTGGKVKAGPLLQALVAAGDGPVAVAVVPERIPGHLGENALLVSMSTTATDDRLPRAAGELLRSVLAPGRFQEVREERIMALPVFHFAGQGHDLYFCETRGFALASTSALLLGRVLKDVQSPSGNTLLYEKTFAAERKKRARPDAGFLFVRAPAVPVPLRILGLGHAAGILAKDGDGVRDEVSLVPGGEGLLADLASGKSRPSRLAGGAGPWLSADLTPSGALQLALGVVSRDVAPRLAALDAFVSGPAELWWPAGKGPLLRFPLKEGADAGAATAPLGSLARVADRALLLSEDPASLAETPKPDPGLDAVAAAAILRAPLPTLLAFFGRAGAASDRETVWRVLAGDGDIVVTSGRLEPGPVTVLAASLLR